MLSIEPESYANQGSVQVNLVPKLYLGASKSSLRLYISGPRRTVSDAVRLPRTPASTCEAHLPSSHSCAMLTYIYGVIHSSLTATGGWRDSASQENEQ
jgi:hypothetical protein